MRGICRANRRSFSFEGLKETAYAGALLDQGVVAVLNRRAFVASLPAAALVARDVFAQPTLKTQRAFLGTTGKDAQGIFTASFDAKTGQFDQPQMAIKIPGNDSMALSPKNRKHLYVSAAVNGGAMVSALEITGDVAQPLRQINQQSATGTIANMVSVDVSGRVVMEANWGSGSINTYLVQQDGGIGPAVEHIEYGEADHGPAPQQPHSRAHSILNTRDGKFVLVNDYGKDRLYIYRLDAATAKLTPHDPFVWKGTAGSAPRHLVLHPNGKWIYCVNEISNTVDLLLWDAKQGTLTLKSTVPTLPEGHAKSYASDLLISPDNRFLYAGNRGVNGFTVWSIGRDGALTQIQFREQTGAQNRCMVNDATGRWMIAANVSTNDITVFPRDPKTGMLGAMASQTKLPGACFVLWG